MKTVKRIKVTMEVPDGIDSCELINYVTHAIESYGGGLHPEDPMFGHHVVVGVILQKDFKRDLSNSL